MAKIHPKSRQNLPLVGVFSTGLGLNQNQIGLTFVKVLRRKRTLFTLGGLDTIKEEPIIDIKPYDDYWDRAENGKLPW